ncbi:hypothetical protein TSUD_301010 [Trifolium subterraneum]|uniref:AMP-binding enzyme C-terminal domain-containing protein n=1 Tax=Trifolium subterraneum TaxID=3900 RepID=A0A2Z6P514_TRISU|nr:hypothetical protein TSUD_301010 [Trifolium subterraneum]
MLTSVPIGLPITNCNVQLIGENSALNEGELYVGGSCIFRGYYNESDGFVKLPQGYGCEDIDDACQSQLYFKTGDLVKQLPTGDFIFLGREDRIVKIHGQRTALEEVENFLREYPYINDAAVVCRNLQAELVLIEAFIILKDKQQLGESLVPAIRSWLSNKLPSVVLPDRFIFIESFPVSSSGKINYESLVISALLTKTVKDKIGNISCSDLLQLIKKLDLDNDEYLVLTNMHEWLPNIFFAVISANVLRTLYTSLCGPVLSSEKFITTCNECTQPQMKGKRDLAGGMGIVFVPVSFSYFS